MVYLKNVKTGEGSAVYRPWPETVRLLSVALGLKREQFHTLEYQAAALSDLGLWVWETDSNGIVSRGSEP